MTIDPNTVPDWAIEEAFKRVGWGFGPAARARQYSADGYGAYQAIILAASLIAKHEEDPVDPLLKEAREIAAKDNWCTLYHDQILAGSMDDTTCVRHTLAGLRRGIELAKGCSNV